MVTVGYYYTRFCCLRQIKERRENLGLTQRLRWQQESNGEKKFENETPIVDFRFIIPVSPQRPTKFGKS